MQARDLRGWIEAMTMMVLIALLSSSLSLAGSVAASTDEEAMRQIEAGRYTPLFKNPNGEKTSAVDSFLLDPYAVTNEQFYRFTEQNQKWHKQSIKAVFSDVNYLQQLTPDSLSSIAQQPVTNVSWFAARAYCKVQGKRLPTTAEWEYASNANDPELRRRILDWYGKPVSETFPVVTETRANKWGVHGMHGVIWEMVDDFNNALVTGESRGDSQLEQSLFCGAGAASSVDPSDYAAFMRYALRTSYRAHYTMTSLGFRCARDVFQQSRNDSDSRGNHAENS